MMLSSDEEQMKKISHQILLSLQILLTRKKVSRAWTKKKTTDILNNDVMYIYGITRMSEQEDKTPEQVSDEDYKVAPTSADKERLNKQRTPIDKKE